MEGGPKGKWKTVEDRKVQVSSHTSNATDSSESLDHRLIMVDSYSLDLLKQSFATTTGSRAEAVRAGCNDWMAKPLRGKESTGGASGVDQQSAQGVPKRWH